MMIAFPILVPFFMMFILLLCRKSIVLQKTAGVAGTALLLAAAVFIYAEVLKEGVLVVYAGGWKAPFGITLVVDRFSSIMLVLTAVVSFCISLFALQGIGKKRHQSQFFLFFFGMLMGVNGVFVTGDIFNMYVWFEVMLMASFILMVLGNGRKQLEGGLKYLVMNLVASMFFLAGIGLLYAYAGTLNLAHLSSVFRGGDLPMGMNAPLALLLVAFSIKAALVPFFFWLPTSYHTPPIAVSAFFAALLTKVGIYAMIRVMTVFFGSFNGFWHNLLLVVAGLTMVAGAFAALSQKDLRRLLSFSIISQMGYLVMGLALFSPFALAGTIYFIMHNVLVKTGLFLLTGIIGGADGTYHLDELRGWHNRYPGIALLFFLLAIALGGIPPLSGFFGKFLLAKAGFDIQQYFIAGLSVFTGLITLSYMFRVWNNVFWKKHEKDTPLKKAIPFVMVLPVLILIVCALLLGFGAGYVLEPLQQAAGQLLNPGEYVNKVLELNYRP